MFRMALRPINDRLPHLRFALYLGLAVLGACAKSAPGVGTAVPPQRSPSASQGGNSAADADMVSAVTASNSTRPISLKFRVSGRPQVGQPVQVILALAAADDAEIERIHASVSVSEGLQLQSERNFDADELSAGETVRREITVVPQRAGVLDITTTIVVDSSAGSMARSYSIPLIASSS